MSGVEVQKEYWNGFPCIRKTIRNKREANVLKLLNQQAFPAPILHEVKESGGDYEMLMEEIQGQHLEICPFSFGKAVEMIHKIQLLNLEHLLEEDPAPSIHSGTLYRQLEHGPAAEVFCAAFDWQQSRIDAIKRILCQAMVAGPLGEPLVPAHGDFHPRNILVRKGKPVPIDWEKAGLHSIYQDIYALLDMSYPNPDACLLNQMRTKWLDSYFKNAAPLIHMGWRQRYYSYVRLNRLVELVSIHQDILQGVRSIESLYHQAEFVYMELMRCKTVQEVCK